MLRLDNKAIALWIIAIVLMAVGLIGTIAPGLPGVLLIYGGMWLAAWIDDFTRIGSPTLTLLGVLTALTFLADILSTVLGARRVGASRQALWGSVIGGFAGLPLGLMGLILGPFVGAVIGEWLARRRLDTAARIGFGTWVGLAFGALTKLALAIAMIAVFVAGLLL